MKIKCDYCGNFISDTDERCPNCGATNSHLKRVGNEVPQTIQKLQDWYVSHNLPPEEVTRFFIGKNIQGTRAFGIYYDESTGNYVVYKNKDNGERAIRYEGKDQSYAVNELYIKLKEEIINQKSNNNNRPSSNNNNYKYRSNSGCAKTILFIVIAFVASFIHVIYVEFNALEGGYYFHDKKPYYLYSACVKKFSQCELYEYDSVKDSWSLSNDSLKIKKKEYVGTNWNNTGNITIKKSYEDEEFYRRLHPPTLNNGYYSYDNNNYYYKNGSWYVYSNNSWNYTSIPTDDISINPDNYYDSSSTENDTYNFDDYYSTYHRSSSSNSSSWDSDSSSSSSSDDSWSSSSNDDSWDSSSSWDSSDSWDSSSTDWSSDW